MNSGSKTGPDRESGRTSLRPPRRARQEWTLIAEAPICAG
jgi:hypothetical protein